MKIKRTLQLKDGSIIEDHGETKREDIKVVGNVIYSADDGHEIMNNGAVMKGVRSVVGPLIKGRTLEIGYGAGYSCKAIRDAGIMHDICEIDKDNFDIIKKHAPDRWTDKNVTIGDFATSFKDKPDGYYDTILADYEIPDQKTYDIHMAETKRLLADDGRYVSVEHYMVRSDGDHSISDDTFYQFKKGLFTLAEKYKFSIFIGEDKDYVKNYTKLFRQQGRSRKELKEYLAWHKNNWTKVFWLATYKK